MDLHCFFTPDYGDKLGVGKAPSGAYITFNCMRSWTLFFPTDLNQLNFWVGGVPQLFGNHTKLKIIFFSVGDVICQKKNLITFFKVFLQPSVVYVLDSPSSLMLSIFSIYIEWFSIFLVVSHQDVTCEL